MSNDVYRHPALPTQLRQQWWDATLTAYRRERPKPTGEDLAGLQGALHGVFSALEDEVRMGRLALADASGFVEHSCCIL